MNTCKGCNQNTLREVKVHNALSRYKHGYICSTCGMREAIEGDFISKVKAYWDEVLRAERLGIDPEELV